MHWKRISTGWIRPKNQTGSSPLDGTIEQLGGFYVVRFERHLGHPVEKVWEAITDPAQLVQWLAAADIEPRPGGKYVLDFENTGNQMPGRVIRYEPPTLFEHTFGDDSNGVVRWELVPAGDDECLLKLSHTIYSTTNMANFAAGWHTHLELLFDLLDGNPGLWEWECWHAHKARYEILGNRF